MGVSMRREIIKSVSIMVGSAIIFVFVFAWLKGTIKDDAVRITNARVTISASAEKVGALAELKQDASIAGQYEDEIKLLLPKKEELLGYTRWLGGLSSAHNVEFKFAFQGGNVDASGNMPGYIGFSLNVDGEYKNIIEFLGAIESKSARFLTAIEDIGIKPAENGLRASVRGKIFSK